MSTVDLLIIGGIALVMCSPIVSSLPTSPNHDLYNRMVQDRLQSISLSGYECVHPNTTMKAFDLTSIKPCNISEDNLSYEDKPIQLIEIKRSSSVTINSCRVEVYGVFFHCGMFSHVSLTKESFYNSYVQLSKEECSVMIMTNKLQLLGREFVSLTPENINIRSFDIGITDGSSCIDGHSITIGEKYFSNIAGVVSLKIEYSQFVGYKKENDETLTFLNGFNCRFQDGTCMIPQIGILYWDIYTTQECLKAKYNLLYEGSSKKLISEHNEYGVYIVEDHDFLFSLKTKSDIVICGYDGYTTEHPDLIIIESNLKNRYQIESSKLDVSKTGNILTYINTKMVYIERLLSENMNDLYIDLLTKQCDLDYKLLKNHLNDAIVNPNGFAQYVTNSEGSMGVLAGEVIYVVQCVAIPVHVRETSKCFQEIPISYGMNETGFLSPINHLILDIGTEVTCTENMYTSFKYMSNWYRVGDKTHVITPPITLAPSIKRTWDKNSPKNLVIGGLYSADTMKDTIDMIYYGRNKNSMANTAVRLGYDSRADQQHYNILRNTDVETIKSLMTKYFDSLTTFTDLLGHYVSVGLGFWLIYSAFIWIINSVIRGFTLYKLGGKPRHLITAIQPAWAHYLMTVKLKSSDKTKTSGRSEVEDDLELEDKKEEIESHTSTLQHQVYPKLPVIRNGPF